MKHIVFSGQIAAGKDEIADMACQLLNKTTVGFWSRNAFAGPVKEIYCEAFNVDRAFVEKWKRNPSPPPGFLMSVRKSLQFIGDGFRQIQDDVWINLALRNNYSVVLSDGRYINEAAAVHRLGGVNILVWRPGFENNDPNMSEAQILPLVKWCLDTNQNGPIVVNADMQPVAGIENYDYFFRNDGSLEELSDKVERELIPYLKDRYYQSKEACG